MREEEQGEKIRGEPRARRENKKVGGTLMLDRHLGQNIYGIYRLQPTKKLMSFDGGYRNKRVNVVKKRKHTAYNNNSSNVAAHQPIS